MNIEEMRKLLHLARSQNIQVSAAAMHITPGALSKTLKKIENQLNTALFERVGRNIQLNTNGQKFVAYASKLVHEFEQMHSEFTDNSFSHRVNITGPSVLLNHCLDKLLQDIEPLNVEVNLSSSFEGEAVNQVTSGHSHLAVVTSEALPGIESRGLASLPLGKTQFKLAISNKHPLYVKHTASPVLLASVLKYPFVCPASSPFCGVVRGVGSDGWPDNKYPRKIRYRTDDFNALVTLVQQGRAIAFIPDLVIKSNDLVTPDIVEFDYQYQEEYCLVYKPSVAFGWLNKLVASYKQY